MEPNDAMPAQPLSSRGKPASCTFEPDALDHRLDFAEPLARSIVYAAHGYHDWAVVLARLTGPAAVLAVSMHTSVRREVAQRNALIAAAITELSSDHYRIFWAVDYEWGKSCDDRNVFAHHVAGWATEHPGLLLFVPPEYLADWSSRIHANRAAYVIDPKKVISFTLKEAQDAANRLKEARQFVLRLGDVLWLRNSDAANSRATLAELVQHPRIIDALKVFDARLAKHKAPPN
jgi:hypothetical protein